MTWMLSSWPAAHALSWAVWHAVLPQTTALWASGCDLHLLLVSSTVSLRAWCAVDRVQQLPEHCPGCRLPADVAEKDKV
jgi:hypothetical protein